MAKSDFIGIDTRAWDEAMQDLADKALPLAARATVNNGAFFAQKLMPLAAAKVLDRPSGFTQKAWLVDRARLVSGVGNITSRLYARRIQSEYLAYVIYGGERGGGSPGAWAKDVPWSPEESQDKFGNRPKNLLQQIQKQMEEEKALRGAGFSRLLAKGRYEGIFFAEIGGVRGYYKRPRRKTLRGPKKKGEVRWGNLGVPRLLIAVSPETHHKPIFRDAYIEVIAQAQAHAISTFKDEFEYQLGRKITGGKNKYSTMRVPDFLKK